MGMYNPLIANLDRIATEFDILGDHTADVAVGDSQSHQYCFIEFEDAATDSVFRKKGNKSTLEWSDRFDHGSSQIIDWLLWLENQRNTQAKKLGPTVTDSSGPRLPILITEPQTDQWRIGDLNP
jgi:Domain of unknown function (DUF4263)